MVPFAYSHDWHATNLSPEQIDRIRSVAQFRSVLASEVLYEPSQPDVPLFIGMEGSVSISRTGEEDKILAGREVNQFTGVMSVISGRRSLLKARVTGDGSAGRDDHCCGSRDRTANQPGGCRGLMVLQAGLLPPQLHRCVVLLCL